MKKLLLVTFILTLAAFAFAGTPRNVYWELDTTPGDILTYVDAPQGSTDPDFLLSVECSAYPGEIYTSATYAIQNPAVFQTDMGVGMMAFASIDQQAWAVDWPVGSNINATLTYLPNTDPVTNTMSASFDVPAGTGPVYFLDAFDTDPGTWDEILSIQTDPVGAAIYVNGVDSGQVAPWDFLNPTEGDVYTVYIDGTYTWDPVDYTVPADFTTTTVNFVGTQAPPDTWTYILNVNGPDDDDYEVTGPFGGTTDYIATDDDDEVNDLLGDYTIEAAPPGYYWEVNPITVIADDFTEVVPVKSGLRSSGAKEDFVYEATIEFVLMEEDTYTLTVTSDPAGAGIWLDGVDTGQVTPYTWDPGVAGTYSLATLPGYEAFVPAEIIVPELTEDTTINFTADPIVIEPDFTFFVEAHDIADPTGPDINAEILFNGMPYDPPIYTPYMTNATSTGFLNPLNSWTSTPTTR